MTTPTNQPSETPIYKAVLRSGNHADLAEVVQLADYRMLQQQLTATIKERDNWKKVVEDDCETEEHIKKLARPHLTDFEVDGDSYGVPTGYDICESLIKRLTTAIAERDSERAKLSSLKLKILTNHVAAICKCGGELTAVGCAHCNLREAVVLATDICNSKLFDENREAVESILEKSIKYKEHLDATTL